MQVENVAQPLDRPLVLHPLVEESREPGNVDHVDEQLVGARAAELFPQTFPVRLYGWIGGRKIVRDLAQFEADRVQPGSNQLRFALRLAKAPHRVGKQIVFFSLAHPVQDTPAESSLRIEEKRFEGAFAELPEFNVAPVDAEPALAVVGKRRSAGQGNGPLDV